ncbi:MAG: peptide deformylase [Clostridia bacterium]|nr:peptide deformylase [Clostridia bacterium]
MAIRNLRYDGDEILTKVSKEIDVIDEKIKELAKDMMDTMHKYDGLGLAGPQVGILKRIIVIDLYEEGMQFTLINPVIIKSKGEQLVEEGCLSFPNKFGKVKRPKEVVVEALDLEGRKVRIEGKDLLAQALCHEIDHLNGNLFIEKVEEGSLEVITPEQKVERVDKKREERKNRK